MTSIGIRELRQRAGVYLRQVQAGETIEITDRGHPIALLCPIPEDSPFERMIAAGQVKMAEASIHDLPEPVKSRPGQEMLSETILRMRADETF